MSYTKACTQYHVQADRLGVSYDDGECMTPDYPEPNMMLFVPDAEPLRLVPMEPRDCTGLFNDDGEPEF